MIQEAAAEAELHKEPDWNRRIDLVLSSGDSILILEFMQPGLTIDRDHISRFQFYVTAVSTRLTANSGGQFRRVVGGYLVADKLNKTPTIVNMLNTLESSGMYALEWETLLRQAEAQWKDFMDILRLRAPDDERLRFLAGEPPENEPALRAGA